MSAPLAIGTLVCVYGMALPYVVLKLGGLLGLHFLVSLFILFPLLLSFATYLISHIFNSIVNKSRNLKTTYNAEWAVVTGASSGIGKAIAKKLASQDLNVVLVALPDKLLDGTYDELLKAYPKVMFKKVGVDLGRTGYLPPIQEATKDIDVSILFCNAGYMMTGFFENTPLEKQLCNLECNSVCAVSITHHFLAQMVAKKLKGCIVFTSSAAAAIPSPFTCLYAATKSFISSFGAALAAEVKHHGIDVMVFHPSPVATRFYDKADKLDVLDFFKAIATPPEALPDIIFGGIGQCVWLDIGATAVCFRLMMKLLDYGWLASLIANTAHLLPDFQRHSQSLSPGGSNGAGGTKKAA